MLPGKARPLGLVNTPVPATYNNPSSQPEARSFDEPRNPPPSRDPPLSRGRLPVASNVPNVAGSQQGAQISSSRSQSSAATARTPTGPNGALERRPSITQGYRYTQRSHAGHQHARNTSFVNSPTTSPLSPQTVTGDYASVNMLHHGTPDLHSKESPLTTVNGSSPLTPNPAGIRDIVDGNPTATTQKRVDRVHNGKLRRGHSQHHNHGRQQHHQEQKTVGEYALHHLFTSVCFYHVSGVRD